MTTDSSGLPALYLFSSADDITDADALKQLISSRRERGDTLISSFDFDDTPHVAHFRFKADVYEEQINAFMETVGGT